MQKGSPQIIVKVFSLVLISYTISLLCGCGESHKVAPTDSLTTTASAVSDGDQGLGKYKDVSLAPLNKKMADKGKTIFESKCWPCHDPSRADWVGPGLKNVTQRRTPAWILNMITNTNEMVEKDSIAHRLLSQRDMKMHVENVSDEDARLILEYLRLNDGKTDN